MFGWKDQDKLDAKAAPLARALRTQYGIGAAEVCRAALTRTELSGERRRIVRHALHMLDWATLPTSPSGSGQVSPP